MKRAVFFLIPLVLFAKSGIFLEKEPNGTFKDALKRIIPVLPFKEIKGSIKGENDTDVYAVYARGAFDLRFTWKSPSAFCPGVVLYDGKKRYIEAKTYAAAIPSEFHSKTLLFRVPKGGFYFIKIADLVRGKGKKSYVLRFVPKEEAYKKGRKTPVSLTPGYLKRLYDREIINEFKRRP